MFPLGLVGTRVEPGVGLVLFTRIVHSVVSYCTLPCKRHYVERMYVEALIRRRLMHGSGGNLRLTYSYVYVKCVVLNYLHLFHFLSVARLNSPHVFVVLDTPEVFLLVCKHTPSAIRPGWNNNII